LKQQSRLIVVGHPCCQRVRPLAGERHQTGARSYAGYSNYSTSLISSTPPPQSSVLPLTLDTVAPAIKRAWTPAEIGATRRGVSFYWRIALLVGATFIVAGEETTSGQKSSDSPSDLTPRVIGGKNAAPGEYPWIVALHRKGAADYYEGHFCGGSLIYPYWVLTAALCVANISPDAVQVVVGAYNLLQPQNTQAIDVLDIIIHPDYVDPDNGDDIALILLAHPPDPLPQTVDLAFDPMTHPPGTNATVIGWGNTVDGDDKSAPAILQSAAVPVVSIAEANQPASYGGGVISSMLPTGRAEGGIDSCKGDSGGPLVIPDPETGRYRQIGIVSVGQGCGVSDKYGIYTRVTSFLPWIKSFVSPNLARWENRYGTLLTQSESRDNDQDGQAAILEFAGNSDPNAGASNLTLAPTITTIGALHYPAVTFSRYQEPSELTYQIQWSRSLGSSASWA
jgi:secreted trypsin-like serine protease